MCGVCVHVCVCVVCGVCVRVCVYMCVCCVWCVCTCVCTCVCVVWGVCVRVCVCVHVCVLCVFFVSRGTHTVAVATLSQWGDCHAEGACTFQISCYRTDLRCAYIHLAV